MPRKKTVPISSARKEGKPMAANEKEFTKVFIRDEEGRKYTLEFNARVVKRMQRNGFKIDTDHLNLMIEELLVGAFQMHAKENGNPMPEKIMKIWAAQTKKDELISILIQLYNRPLEDLMAEPDGEDENADPTWETA